VAAIVIAFIVIKRRRSTSEQKGPTEIVLQEFEHTGGEGTPPYSKLPDGKENNLNLLPPFSP